MRPPAPTPDARLVADAIEASGLSATAFAEDVLARDARTVFRWLAGAPVPKVVKRRCERLLMDARERATVASEAREAREARE